MQFTNHEIIASYNIIFHILNFLMKVGIRMTFGFYSSYYEVNINPVYHMIILIVKEKLEKKLIHYYFDELVMNEPL